MFSFRTNICQWVMKRNEKTNSTASCLFFHGKVNSSGVLIGYYVTKHLDIINKRFDNSGWILLLETNVVDSLFVLIIIYNANDEPNQLKNLTVSSFSLNLTVLVIFKIICNFRWLFNVYFYSFLEVQGETQSLNNSLQQN